jgi:predicted acyl esterase
MVAMRDGVKLATDVYLPQGGTGKVPVILARTAVIGPVGTCLLGSLRFTVALQQRQDRAYRPRASASA